MNTKAQQFADEHDDLSARVAKLAKRVAVLEGDDDPDVTDVVSLDNSDPIKNQSAERFEIVSPTRVRSTGAIVPTHGVWLEDGSYRLGNGTIAGYGGERKEKHGIYAEDCVFEFDYLHIHGATRRGPLSKVHAMYLSGSSAKGKVLVIGHPDDKVLDHDIDINATVGDTDPQEIDIDVVIVFGGHRLVIEADPDSLKRLRIGVLIVVNPVGTDGRWEGIEIDGCPDVEIGEYIVLDTEGRINKLALIDADNCEGRIGSARVYAPFADRMRDIIAGVEGEVVWLDELPQTTPPPGYGPEFYRSWIAWARGAK